MKDLFLFREDFWVSILAWFITLAVAGGLFFLIDYVGGTAHDSVGIEDGKHYMPAHVQMIYHSDGKGGGWMQTIYIPESWSIDLHAEGDDHNFGCSEYCYNTTQYGDTIYCTLVTGCITGIVYAGHLK